MKSTVTRVSLYPSRARAVWGCLALALLLAAPCRPVGGAEAEPDDLDELEPVEKGEPKKAPEVVRAPDFPSPKTTWLTMWDAARAGKREKVLACLTKESAARLRTAEKLLAERASELPDAMKGKSVLGELCKEAGTAKMRVGEENIQGDRATLAVRFDEHTETFKFVTEADVWKMDLELPDADQMRSDLERLIQAQRAGKRERRPK
jgi:hypothetical protein